MRPNGNGQHPPLRRMTNTATTLNGKFLWESPDSCYSSSSEPESHSVLSREPSDNMSVNGDSEQIFEFATKLGYSESTIRSVLENLGQNAEKDRVLFELIKMGKSPKKYSQNAETARLCPPKLTFDVAASTQKKLLRPIVIDGSNVAMSHGRNEVFSCRGIRECVDYFVRRGHEEIFVFVPQFRREKNRPDSPITDQNELFKLEAEGYLFWTPSRRINGRRIVCHDDRYILKLAIEKDAVVVSNDEYRDLARESPEFRRCVQSSVLMYSFVDGSFMPPDDPLGRHGPRLDRFLQKMSALNQTPCPYAKKCTYGNKCKFFHPERTSGLHLSTTAKLLSANTSRKQSLSARPSISGISDDQNRDKVFRTKSLNATSGSSIFSTNDSNFEQINFLPVPLSSFSRHTQLSRHTSAPIRPDQQQRIVTESNDIPMNRFSMSSTVLNDTAMFVPSKAIWGESEFSFSHDLSSMNNSFHTTESPASVRQKIHHNLCQIFPEASVLAILNAHPNETDPQILCQRILAFQNGFKN